jgi:ferric-dicitrate binding protein FerR (iron transport regulator)
MDEANEAKSRGGPESGTNPREAARQASESEHLPARDALSSLLRLAAPRPAVPIERATRVEAMVREQWRQRVRARRQRRWMALAAAAALVAVLGASLWRWPAAPDPVPGPPIARIERVVGVVELAGEAEDARPVVEGEELGAGATLATGEDGRTALRLDKGVSLRLDRSTRVRLTEPGRIELVEGALYVDSPSGLGDLRVATDWGEVWEIGTQFEVRAARERLRVRVREGMVELRPGDAVYGAGSGVELSLEENGRLTRRAISPHDTDWDWVASIAPSFELDGRTLEEFLAWVSRETGREIRFADADLAANVLGVVLRGAVVDLSPDQALLAVLPTCGLEHRAENGAFVLVRP